MLPAYSMTEVAPGVESRVWVGFGSLKLEAGSVLAFWMEKFFKVRKDMVRKVYR